MVNPLLQKLNQMALPQTPSARQPTHVVYGGAHLFQAETFLKLARLAQQNFETFLTTPEHLAKILHLEIGLATKVWQRVGHKLAHEPIEDFRVDFEDGFGPRPSLEEDAAATHAGQVAAALENRPAFFGLRVKALTPSSGERALKTLDLFLSGFSKSQHLGAQLLVTVPKVTSRLQVEVAAAILGELEMKYRLPNGFLKLEVMVESAQGVFDSSGKFLWPQFYEASQGRLWSAHFGAYDYTASLGIAAQEQRLSHPACDLARSLMQLGFSTSPVFLSDGATTELPVAPHRGGNLTSAQEQENSAAILRAMVLHASNVARALTQGFFQGWDLHPAQIPIRYAATFAYFHGTLALDALRLRQFVAAAAQARVSGTVFDDAATGQGLFNSFLKAIACGALTEAEATEITGLTFSQMQAKDFSALVSKAGGLKTDADL
jgi:citrate lyase beta subunit